MNRLFAFTAALAFCISVLGISKAYADDGVWITPRLHLDEAIRMAVLMRAREIQRDIELDLSSYHPMPTGMINQTTDVKVLRAQLIAAQNAAEVIENVVAQNALPGESLSASAQSLDAFNASAKANASQKHLAAPVTSSIGGTRYATFYDVTANDLAPAQTPAVSTACNVMTYVTGAWGTGGPQFVTSTGATTGQKNTLSIIGFVLGVVPIAMNCTKDHATTPNAGQQQQPSSP